MKLAVVSMGSVSSELIAKEAKAFFSQVDFINVRDIDIQIASNKIIILNKNKPLEDYDCIYLRGSSKYVTLLRSITRALNKTAYMPIKPESFVIGHNKFLTQIELQKYNIPMPTTYLTATTESAKKLLETVRYPIIIKVPGGTHGKGVMFADSMNAAKSVLDTLEVFKQPYLIQEFIETGGTDIRAIVAGDRVVASMKRKATKEEFRANIHAGGKGVPFVPDYDTEQIAVKAAKALGADICGVDILEGRKSMVIEVNLSPGMQGISNAIKKNVPLMVAGFLAEKTKEFLIQKQKEEAIKVITPEEKIKKQKGKIKELIANLDIRAGMMKLPKLVADIANFKPDDEVAIRMEKGKISIKRQEIKKESE